MVLPDSERAIVAADCPYGSQTSRIHYTYLTNPFKDRREFHDCMAPYLHDSSPGDTLHVAWIEDDHCSYGRFTACEPIQYTQHSTLVALHDTTDGCLLVTPSLPIYMPEPPASATPTGPAYRVLGVAPSRDALYWRILRLLLVLDYSPVTVLDLILLRYMNLPLESYAEHRTKSAAALQADVDALVENLTTVFCESGFVTGGPIDRIFRL